MMDEVQEQVNHEEEWKRLERGRKCGRNERCMCGSGLKYKRCCERGDNVARREGMGSEVEGCE